MLHRITAMRPAHYRQPPAATICFLSVATPQRSRREHSNVQSVRTRPCRPCPRQCHQRQPETEKSRSHRCRPAGRSRRPLSARTLIGRPSRPQKSFRVAGDGTRRMAGSDIGFTGNSGTTAGGIFMRRGRPARKNSQPRERSADRQIRRANHCSYAAEKTVRSSCPES